MQNKDAIIFTAADGQPVGVIEARKETLGHKITAVETAGYSTARLKWVQQTTLDSRV